MGTARNKTGWTLPLAILLAMAISASAQTAKKPVRKPAPPQAETSPTAAMVDKAEDAIGHKDYPAAEQLLKTATATDAKDYRAWFDLGFVYSSTDRRDEAIDAYRKSVAIKADIFESNLNLGVLLAGAGNPEAEKFLRTATKLKPTHDPVESTARAWLALGRALENSNPKDAVAAFQEAGRLRPKDAEPHIAAGIILERSGDLNAAEAEFKQGANLDPKAQEALAGLVNVYTRGKRLPEAEKALREYLAVDPSNSAARVQLGRVLAALGRNQEAAVELEAGMQNSPDPAGLRELAGLHAVAKEYEKAAAEYRKLLQSNPKDADVHFALGTVLMDMHKPAEAAQEFAATVNLKPDMAAAYGSLAVVASENKDYPLALHALEVRAKYLPENAGTYFLRATAYDHLHAYKEAALNYHQFLTASNGQNPDREWQATHRLIAIEPKKK